MILTSIESVVAIFKLLVGSLLRITEHPITLQVEDLLDVTSVGEEFAESFVRAARAFWIEPTVITRIEGHVSENTLDVLGGRNHACGETCFADHWCRDRRENRDNRDHHQQFDQGEASILSESGYHAFVF